MATPSEGDGGTFPADFGTMRGRFDPASQEMRFGSRWINLVALWGDRPMDDFFKPSTIEPLLTLLGTVGFFFFAIQAYRQLEK